MAQHTPGPWLVFDNMHCVGGPVGPLGAPTAGGTTAGVALCSMRHRTPEEQQANARLIAAAPALLASLKALVAHLLYHHTFGLNHHADALVRQAEDSVLQAEGERGRAS